MQQETHTDLIGSELLQGLTDSDKILQGLGHLQTINVEMTCMEEVIHGLTRMKREKDSPTHISYTPHSEPSHWYDEEDEDPHLLSEHQCSHR